MLDIVIVSILVCSIITSFMRGFIIDSLSFVTWIVATWVSFIYAESIAIQIFGSLFPTLNERLSVILAFAVLFLIILIIGVLLSLALRRRDNKINIIDRLLGIPFGAFRGIVLLVLFALLAAPTPFPQAQWWKESVFIEPFISMAISVKTIMPEDVANYFIYEI